MLLKFKKNISSLTFIGATDHLTKSQNFPVVFIFLCFVLSKSIFLMSNDRSKSTLPEPRQAGSPCALCLIVQSTFLPQELLQGVTVFKDVLVGNTSLFGTPFHSSFSSSLLSSIPSHISALKCTRIHFFA